MLFAALGGRGASLELEGRGLILGVGRVLDVARTTVNEAGVVTVGAHQ